MRILRNDKYRDKEGTDKQWRSLTKLAANDTERLKIINILGNTPKPWAISVLEELKAEAKGDTVKMQADRAMKAVQDLLKNTSKS